MTTVKKLIKLFRPFLLFMARVYWYLVNPKTSGVKVIIRYENEILLVKNTYGYNYVLPGGGIKKGETKEEAARRETREEVGIQLETLTLLSSCVTHEEFHEDTVYCFYTEVNSKNYKLDAFEIDVAEWHPLDTLPKVGSVTGMFIDLYKKLYLYNNSFY